jgi:hypothetical protein
VKQLLPYFEYVSFHCKTELSFLFGVFILVLVIFSTKLVIISDNKLNVLRIVAGCC